MHVTESSICPAPVSWAYVYCTRHGKSLSTYLNMAGKQTVGDRYKKTCTIMEKMDYYGLIINWKRERLGSTHFSGRVSHCRL